MKITKYMVIYCDSITLVPITSDLYDSMNEAYLHMKRKYEQKLASDIKEGCKPPYCSTITDKVAHLKYDKIEITWKIQSFEMEIPVSECALNVPGGTITAYTYGSGEIPAAGLQFTPEGDDIAIDLVYVEAGAVPGNKEYGGCDNDAEDPKDLVMYTYQNPYMEEWQDKYIIKRADVVKALGIDKFIRREIQANDE